MIGTTNQPIEYKNIFWVLISLYVGAVIFAVIQGIPEITVLPLVLMIVYMALFHFEKLFFLTVALIPLAINLSETDFGIGMSLPTEPIIFGMMLLFWIKILMNNGIKNKFFSHPISIVILLHLAWMIITSITSTMPLVSLKYTLARFVFVSVFYFIPLYIFKSFSKIKSFIWCYISTLSIVIIYSIYNQAQGGFSDAVAHHCMTPFYNDHTAYAAAISFFIPLLVMLIFIPNINSRYRSMMVIVSVFLVIAVILSYTRASWIGIMAAFLLGFVMLLRIPYWVLLIGSVIVITGFFTFQTEILIKLSETKQESSNDLASHVQSVSNIKSDASNVERLNRWSCVLRMHELKPWLGWGPGTYQFVYAPFQKHSEKTIISTNFGTGGNAHSEYLGPLAEQGIPGMISYILIVAVVLFKALIFIANTSDLRYRLTAIGLILGLITYWVHGLLNNFLDTDKSSVLHWGFISALVAMEFIQKEKDNKMLTASSNQSTA